jgi:DNA-binding response OmpR family regulator
MAGRERFLVVEDDADGEFILERALLRRFREASVQIFRDTDDAVNAAGMGEWRGFVVHRALDLNGIEVVRRLQRAAPGVRIIMVSGRDQESAALAAGATHFLAFGEWQRLGGLFDDTA